MATDPERDDLDSNDSYDSRREESVTTDLDDVEVVDPDAPPTVAELMNDPNEPPAPDPAEITARIAIADVDGLVGDAEPQTTTNAPAARTLADRLKFEDVQRPRPTPRPQSAAPLTLAPEPSFLGKLLGKLFGKRG
jgi:hypothetical protein